MAGGTLRSSKHVLLQGAPPYLTAVCNQSYGWYCTVWQQTVPAAVRAKNKIDKTYFMQYEWSNLGPKLS
eukprot:scaffold25747_cov23-Tisochrysis_lutea.AAC.1